MVEVIKVTYPIPTAILGVSQEDMGNTLPSFIMHSFIQYTGMTVSDIFQDLSRWGKKAWKCRSTVWLSWLDAWRIRWHFNSHHHKSQILHIDTHMFNCTPISWPMYCTGQYTKHAKNHVKFVFLYSWHANK